MLASIDIRKSYVVQQHKHIQKLCQVATYAMLMSARAQTGCAAAGAAGWPPAFVWECVCEGLRELESETEWQSERNKKILQQEQTANATNWKEE